MEQVTEENADFRVLDPETRATIEEVSYVLVTNDFVFVIRDGKRDYAIPDIEYIKIYDPDYVECTGTGTVVYQVSDTVTIQDKGEVWQIVSDD